MVLHIPADLGLATVPLIAESRVRLAALRMQTGLRLPDCAVLLAAEASGAHIATFDGRLARAADALGFGAVPLP